MGVKKFLFLFSSLIQKISLSGLTNAQKPVVMEFWKSKDTLVVTSDPLFKGMGDPSKIDTPEITRDQLKCMCAILLPFCFSALNFVP